MRAESRSIRTILNLKRYRNNSSIFKSSYLLVCSSINSLTRQCQRLNQKFVVWWQLAHFLSTQTRSFLVSHRNYCIALSDDFVCLNRRKCWEAKYQQRRQMAKCRGQQTAAQVITAVEGWVPTMIFLSRMTVIRFSWQGYSQHQHDFFFLSSQ